MTTCYFICDENTTGAQKFRFMGNGWQEIWLLQQECCEPLYSALLKEVRKWVIEEYYTEDDDHGDAFRYFDSETIYHAVTMENAIIRGGRFIGALYCNKADGSLIPVLIGNKSYASTSERLSSTHDLQKQSSGELIRRDSALKSVFESERIRFVKVSELLVPDYLTMINDVENVGRFISSSGEHLEPYSEQQEIRWVQKKLRDNGPYFSMIEKETREFIGNVEFMDATDTEGELGIAITAAKQDLGYGSEAILRMIEYGRNQLGLKRIFLKANPDNLRAIHVYERSGFREYDRNDDHIYMELPQGDL